MKKAILNRWVLSVDLKYDSVMFIKMGSMSSRVSKSTEPHGSETDTGDSQVDGGGSPERERE